MLPIEIIKLKKIFFVNDPSALCRLPYPGHPKGCPNWNRSPNCPPKAQRIEEEYDLSKASYFVIQPFDIASQKEKMKALHPNWSDKKCACCLYWQNGVRKKLTVGVYAFKQKLYAANWGYSFDYELIPEAMGIDVFETAHYHGLSIERNPQNILYKIAFVGGFK
jgi:hypothetical protein